MPSLRQVPQEIRREMSRFLARARRRRGRRRHGLADAAPLAAVALTFVLVTAGLAVYERRYARAAAATRARLS